MITIFRMRLPALGVALLALLLSGCFVGSLQPLYNANDPVFDKNMLGVWVSSDERNTMIISRVPGSAQDKQYHLVYITEGSGSVYQAKLVDIAKTRYLDVYSRDSSRRPDIHFIPTHSLWKIAIEGDSLKVIEIGRAHV